MISRSSLLMMLTGLALLLVPASAFGESNVLKRTDFSYSIAVPEGWRAIEAEKLPKNLLRRYRAISGASRNKKLNQQLDAVLRPENLNSGQVLPAVTLSVTDLRREGVVPGRVPVAYERAIEKFKARGSGSKPVEFTPEPPVLKPGDVQYGKKSRQFRVAKIQPRRRGGKIRVEVWTKMGDAYSVYLALVSPVAKWSRIRSARKTLYDSFQLADSANIDDLEVTAEPRVNPAQQVGANIAKVLIFCL